MESKTRWCYQFISGGCTPASLCHLDRQHHNLVQLAGTKEHLLASESYLHSRAAEPQEQEESLINAAQSGIRGGGWGCRNVRGSKQRSPISFHHDEMWGSHTHAHLYNTYLVKDSKLKRRERGGPGLLFPADKAVIYRRCPRAPALAADALSVSLLLGHPSGGSLLFITSVKHQPVCRQEEPDMSTQRQIHQNISIYI